MRIDPENETLRRALGFIGKEAGDNILDSLACYMHNEGHSLAGNTEASDHLWLARIILKERVHRHADNWEQATAIEREEALHLATIAMRCLPELCGRIASRYIRASRALRSVEEVRRAQRAIADAKRDDPDHGPLANQEAALLGEIDRLKAENEQLKVKMSRVCDAA